MPSVNANFGKAVGKPSRFDFVAGMFESQKGAFIEALLKL